MRTGAASSGRCPWSRRRRSCASGSRSRRLRPQRGAEGGRAVLVRIGSRGSRLALTQAEQAAAALRRPAIEIAFVPITTAGDRDRTRPFGQIGERGVFVKEIEEALLARPHRRRGALGEGHDVDRYRRARRSAPTSSGTIRATRSSARRRFARGCASARPRRAGARSCSRSIRPSRSSRCAATSTPACASMRERGLDAIVLAACGLDRLGLVRRDRRAARAGRHASRGGAGRARAAGARRRGGSRRSTPITPRHDGASSPSDAASRRSAPAVSRPSPPITTVSLCARSSRTRTAPGSSGVEGGDPEQLAARLLAARAARLAA